MIKNANSPDFNGCGFTTNHIIIENTIIADILPSEMQITPANFDMVIDATEMITSPGFIDVHSHSDIAALNCKIKNPKIAQGIATEIVGNCGLSVAPVTEANRAGWKNLYSSIWGNDEIEWDWTDAESYLEVVRKNGTNNIETLIGYSTIRYLISGLSADELSAESLKKVEYIIERELEAGALGISIGIGYPPNIYATPAEYELICKLLKKHDKILAVHLRDEGDRVVESINEILGYAEKSKCKIEFSHLKAYGKRNWHKVSEILNLIDVSIKSGYDITFDSYPYTAGSTTLNSLLPPALLDKPLPELFDKLKSPATKKYIRDSINHGIDNWENYAGTLGFSDIYPTGLANSIFKDFEGMSISEISSKTSLDPVDLICEIIITEKGKASMIMQSMDECNVIDIFKHHKHLIGSDGLFNLKPHPRTFGCFPRVLNRFCKELNALDINTALKQMTVAPAERFGLKNRGLIKKNLRADIVIFDYKKIRDLATYFNPVQYPEGINYMIVNGRLI